MAKRKKGPLGATEGTPLKGVKTIVLDGDVDVEFVRR